MMKKLLIIAAALALLTPLALLASGQSATGATTGPYKMSVLYGGAPTEKEETFRVLIEEYGKKNPDADIEIVTVAGNFWAQVKVLAAADDLTDIMRLDDDWSGEHMVYGNVIDLTDRIKKEIKVEDIYLQAWLPFVYKGRIYGLPYDAAVDVIYYNKNHFKDAGLAEPPRDPKKWTNALFLADAQKLTMDRNGDGKTDQWGFTYPAATTGYYQAQHWLWREGTTLYDKDKTQVTMPNDPVAVAAMQFYTDLRNKYGVAPAMDISQQMGGSPMFNSGNVSMLLNANWELPNLEKSRKNGVIDYGAVYTPAGKVGTITRVTCDAWGITKMAHDVDKAWDFLKWMNSVEGQKIMAGQGTFTPPNKKVAQTEEYQQNPNTYYDEALFVEIVEKYSRMGEICLQGSEVSDVWGRAMEPLWYGKEDALAAPKRYKELLDPVLAKEADKRPFAPWYYTKYSELF